VHGHKDSDFLPLALSTDWILEFLDSFVSLYHHKEQCLSNEQDVAYLVSKTTEFEKQARNAFMANPRFIEQFFDPVDFAYDNELTACLLQVLKSRLEAIMKDISETIALVTQQTSFASNNALPLYLDAVSALIRGLRNLSTQTQIRKTLLQSALLTIPFYYLMQQSLAATSQLSAIMKSSLSSLSRSIVQFANNLCVSNSANMDIVWSAAFPTWLMYVLFISDSWSIFFRDALTPS
jgi:hypothetical protein